MINKRQIHCMLKCIVLTILFGLFVLTFFVPADRFTDSVGVSVENPAAAKILTQAGIGLIFLVYLVEVLIKWKKP